MTALPIIPGRLYRCVEEVGVAMFDDNRQQIPLLKHNELFCVIQENNQLFDGTIPIGRVRTVHLKIVYPGGIGTGLFWTQNGKDACLIEKEPQP